MEGLVIRKRESDANPSDKKRRVLRVMLIAAVAVVLSAAGIFGFMQAKFRILRSSEGQALHADLTDFKKATCLTVGYVPEGFELVARNRMEHGRQYIYEHEGNLHFFFVTKVKIKKTASEKTGTVTVKKGFEPYSTMEVNGITYTLFGTDHTGSGAFWTDGAYEYEIGSNITVEEVTKIMLSVY